MYDVNVETIYKIVFTDSNYEGVIIAVLIVKSNEVHLFHNIIRNVLRLILYNSIKYM